MKLLSLYIFARYHLLEAHKSNSEKVTNLFNQFVS